MVLSRWPGARELRELIKQQRLGRWGRGEQFQYNVPRALFPSLRTWRDSEGSQVPSCRAGRAQLPLWVVGNKDVPIQAGFASGLHFPKGFWRQVCRQTGRTSLRRQMSSRVPQAKAPMVCPGFYHIPVRWPVPRAHLCSKPGQGGRGPQLSGRQERVTGLWGSASQTQYQ